MAKKSTSETGHAVNVGNFSTLISRCTGYNTPVVRYQPSNTLIQIANMQTTYTNSNNSLAAVDVAKPPYTKRVNERHPLFHEMELLATRIVNALDASPNVDDEEVQDAMTFVRKIRGARKGKKILNPNPDDPQQISVSQQSYIQQLEHFNGLIAFVAAETNYNPNEVELQNAQLTIFAQSLATANDNVTQATTPYLTALTNRNNLLYTPITGLVDVALEAKKYVKSVKAILLSEYRQISGLKFRRPPKKK
jgi:hypothetical protein